ncbi:lethal giant larvae like, C-terminal-domain-containing protein [Triangularia verruculosa]|uniref:Lethal giant larvae like, C-terminal-domain-containing protein n=1 Tax=Triangularia verruculosa TaxID=2587418 RepID=A0AAN6XNC6_9PEZI|nr:lethal giant larvae like, C-terminal-domain-containing protein [Triangularia verruculosa]
MASFLRAKQSGVATDLSSGLLPGSFNPDELARYGINSQVSCIAYDPVQSLLAVGTSPSSFSPQGKIYVFGGGRVHRVLGSDGTKQGAVGYKQLRFVGDLLVSVDTGGELVVWELMTGEKRGRYTFARVGGEVVADPGLDWVFVPGGGNGGVEVFDLDRGRVGGFRLPCFVKMEQRFGREVMGDRAGVVAMAMHPRDVGKLAIGYAGGVVGVYSFKMGGVQRWFEPPPETKKGGRLTNVVWHPGGSFLMGGYEDGRMVFWDVKEGRVLAVRDVYGVVVEAEKKKDLVGLGRVKWCCKGGNPDDTGLVVAAGWDRNETKEKRGITFIDLGPTPVYATSSWEVLGGYFRGRGEERVVMEMPPGAEVVDYCLIPRESPHFDGAQDPIAVMAMLSSGEIITLSFPSGWPITPTNMLHPSLSFVHPFVQKIGVASVPRERWLGMVEKRSQGETILRGGKHHGSSTRRKMVDVRNVIQVAHADSTVRIWDAGYGDEVENPGMLQVDVARAVGRFEDVSVSAIHMGEATGEFAAGTKTGEVVVFKWGVNTFHGRDATKPLESNPGGLTDISTRAEPSLKEGLQPFVLYEMAQGPISALCVSDVGFIGVGSEGGHFSILDLRGPSIIYAAPVTDFITAEKKSFLKKSSSSNNRLEFPTAISFGVMTLEGDSYSSICCFVGTNLGHIATFRLLPSGNSYTAKPAGHIKTSSSDRVISLNPINSETGSPATATGPSVAGLRSNMQTHGVLVAITQSEIRIFKPATNKGASKSFDDQLCDSARVVHPPNLSPSIICLFGDRTTRAYAIPSLKELGRVSLAMLDPSRTLSSVISKTGELIAWNGPSEIAVMPVYGSGRGLAPSTDVLITPERVAPPRPTISNLQWISGTQYVSPTDLDLLIGGEGRPPSKRMIQAAEAERLGQSGAAGSSSSRAGGGLQEGWGDYLVRQVNERTEKLSFVDDAMMKLQEASAGWADDVNKTVKDQKRGLLLGGLKKSFF